MVSNCTKLLNIIILCADQWINIAKVEQTMPQASLTWSKMIALASMASPNCKPFVATMNLIEN